MWTQRKNILRVTDKRSAKQVDQLIVEKASTLVLNGQDVCDFVHTPQLEKAAGVGYFAAQGLLLETLDRVSYENGYVRVDCSGDALVFESRSVLEKVDKHQVFRLTAYFQEAALLFKQTAISESAALGSGDVLDVKAEDLSQEMAFFKVIGQAILAGKRRFVDDVLLVSSKCDLAFVRLCVPFGFKAIITRTAPTFQAIELATDNNVLLVGFARGKRFNCYNRM